MHKKTLKLAVSAIALMTFAQLASAADLSARRSAVATYAPVAPVSTWTGCYVGANVGYGWAPTQNFDLTFEGGDSVGKATAKGFLGGAQIGCDYQFAGNWVIGVQGMFDFGHLKGDSAYGPDHDFTDHTKIEWLSTATARLGFTPQPLSLFYVKGGAAWARNKLSDTQGSDSSYFTRSNGTSSGWTVGAGWEYKFAPNWSLFAEYNFIDLGKEKFRFTGSETYDYNVKQQVHQVLLGANWRFNAP